MAIINPSQRSIDYNCALMDVKAFVEEKREKGWHFDNILDAVSAMGREGAEQVNRILSDMADRLEKRA